MAKGQSVNRDTSEGRGGGEPLGGEAPGSDGLCPPPSLLLLRLLPRPFPPPSGSQSSLSRTNLLQAKKPERQLREFTRHVLETKTAT